MSETDQQRAERLCNKWAIMWPETVMPVLLEAQREIRQETLEPLQLYECIYGAERRAMLRRLRKWKAQKLTHAEGALVERDLPDHEKLDEAIRALLAEEESKEKRKE